MNEITTHMLEVVYAHLQLSRQVRDGGWSIGHCRTLCTSYLRAVVVVMRASLLVTEYTALRR